MKRGRRIRNGEWEMRNGRLDEDRWMFLDRWRWEGSKYTLAAFLGGIMFKIWKGRIGSFAFLREGARSMWIAVRVWNLESGIGDVVKLTTELAMHTCPTYPFPFPRLHIKLFPAILS